MLRTLRRTLCAISVAALVLPATGEADARSEITIEGWRPYGVGGFLDVSNTGERDPLIKLRARLANFGLEQTVVAPSAPFALRIDGALVGADTQLILEWQRAGRVVSTRSWALEPTKRGARLRVHDAPAADYLRIILVVEEGSAALVDAIRLDGSDPQALVNPGLVPRGCSPTARSPHLALGPVEIPHWRRRYLNTELDVRGAELTVTSLRLAGIDQYLRAPRGRFQVTVDGDSTSDVWALLEFKRASSPTPNPQPGVAVAHEVLRRLRFRGGRATVRAHAPTGRPRLFLGMGVLVRGRRPAVDLRRISLRDGGRELLRNPDLAGRRCAAGPRRPVAAGTLPGTARWALTTLLVAALAAGIAWLIRSTRSEAGGTAADPIFTLSLVGVALTPLVSVGTVKLGLRVIPADVVFSVAAIMGASRSELRRAVTGDPYRLAAVVAAAILTLIGAVGLIIAALGHTDANLAALVTGDQLRQDIGPPFQRGALDELRLLQGALALAVLAAVLTSAERWKQCARVFVFAASVAALYGVCQVLVQRVFGESLQPPGSFPYPELLRASSTFPEPTAFGGYAVVTAAIGAVAWQVAPSRLLAAALGMLLVGAALSGSPPALLGLLVLVTGAALSLHRRSRVWLALVTVGAVALTVALAGIDRAISVVDKPLGTTNSVLDRKVTWSAAFDMGSAYAPIGVGRGQFAYNVAPFIEPTDAVRSGRAQSALLEVWSEHGPVGVALCLSLAAVAALTLLHYGRGLDQVPRRLLWTALATLGTVFVAYYTSNYVWPWVALGLLVTAPSALSPPRVMESAPPASQ